MQRMIIVTAMLVMGLSTAWAANVQPDAIDGYWRVAGGDAVIRITGNGRGDQHVGRIAWLAEPEYSDTLGPSLGGKPKVDRNNPDQALRSRRLVGLKLLWGLEFNGQRKWVGGDIYNLKSGKTYNLQVWLDGHDKLKVHGFVGVAFFGGTTTWKRSGPPPFQQ